MIASNRDLRLVEPFCLQVTRITNPCKVTTHSGSATDRNDIRRRDCLDAWSAKVGHGRDLDRQDGDVVLRSLASLPPRDLPQYAREPDSKRFGSASLKRLQEPGLAKAFAASIHRIGESIGVQIHA